MSQPPPEQPPAPPPNEPKPNEFADVWPKIIPGVAISLQLALDNILNLEFVQEDTKVFQCNGKNELAWRTVSFIICFFAGFAVMKRFDTKRLFHEIVNVGLITGWLLSVSYQPLTCWISTSDPLSTLQTRNVQIVRLFIVAIVNNMWAFLETYQPAALNFIDGIGKKILPDKTGR